MPPAWQNCCNNPWPPPRFPCRSRSEEASIPLDYLRMLHENHEDWLHEQSVSAEALVQDPLAHAEGQLC